MHDLTAQIVEDGRPSDYRPLTPKGEILVVIENAQDPFARPQYKGPTGPIMGDPEKTDGWPEADIESARRAAANLQATMGHAYFTYLLRKGT